MQDEPDITSNLTMGFTPSDSAVLHHSNTGAGHPRISIHRLEFPMSKQQDRNSDSDLLVDLNDPQVKPNKTYSSIGQTIPGNYFQGFHRSQDCDMFSRDDPNIGDRTMSCNNETAETSPNSMLRMDVLNGT